MSELYDSADYLSPTEDDDDECDLLEDVDFEDESESEKKIETTTQQSNPSSSQPHNPWGQSQSGWKPAYQPAQQSPFGTWGQGNNTAQPQWGGYRPPGSTPTWGNNGSSWYNGSSWNNNNNNNFIGNRRNLPRHKKIVMCDLFDNVIEPLSCNGKLGSSPQGIYDLRIKFEVLDKFRAINPEFLFVLTNQNFTPGTSAEAVYKVMVDYVMHSIAEYMRLPYGNVRCITKTGYDIQDEHVKPNTGLIQLALKTIPGVKKRFKKSDILVCGVSSGTAGQGNRDIEMARRFGVDYIDILELLNNYA